MSRGTANVVSEQKKVLTTLTSPPTHQANRFLKSAR
jgi:hypothetical protein